MVVDLMSVAEVPVVGQGVDEPLKGAVNPPGRLVTRVARPERPVGYYHLHYVVMLFGAPNCVGKFHSIGTPACALDGVNVADGLVGKVSLYRIARDQRRAEPSLLDHCTAKGPVLADPTLRLDVWRELDGLQPGLL